MSRWSDAYGIVKRPDIATLEVGDSVMAPVFNWCAMAPQKGTIVYIHPEKRFFTVQFENGIRESYCTHGYYS